MIVLRTRKRFPTTRSWYASAVARASRLFESDVLSFLGCGVPLHGVRGWEELGGAVELYVPATGTFAKAADMTTGRHEHRATLLPDGTVLIAGGCGIWPHPTASAEIYNQGLPVLEQPVDPKPSASPRKFLASKEALPTDGYRIDRHPSTSPLAKRSNP
jgi:hypothetical protein